VSKLPKELNSGSALTLSLNSVFLDLQHPELNTIMHSYRRPSISLIPLVHDDNDLPDPPGQDSLVDTPTKRYRVPRRGIPFFPWHVNPIVRIFRSRHPLSHVLYCTNTLGYLYRTLYVFCASPRVCCSGGFQCCRLRDTLA